MKKKDKNKKEDTFIRSDGWVFSKEGMRRLKEGGQKGFERFKKSMEAKLGKWHRVSKPLDRDAAAFLKTVKGLAERGLFLSNAILAESQCRGRAEVTYAAYRSEMGEGNPAEFMRLTLTDEAYQMVSPLENRVFREFVSSAILRAAKGM